MNYFSHGWSLQIGNTGWQWHSNDINLSKESSEIEVRLPVISLVFNRLYWLAYQWKAYSLHFQDTSFVTRNQFWVLRSMSINKARWETKNCKIASCQLYQKFDFNYSFLHQKQSFHIMFSIAGKLIHLPFQQYHVCEEKLWFGEKHWHKRQWCLKMKPENEMRITWPVSIESMGVLASLTGDFAIFGFRPDQFLSAIFYYPNNESIEMRYHWKV